MDTAAELPSGHWLLDALHKPGASNTGDPVVEPDNLDRPSDLLAADALIARWPRVEHGHRDNSGLQLCAALYDLGLSHPERHVRLSAWNQELPEPMDQDEVDTIAASVARGNIQNNVPGAKSRAAIEDRMLLAEMSEKHPTFSNTAPSPQNKFRWQRSGYLHNLKDPEWLIEDVIPAGAFVQIYGQQGSFKSFIALDMCFTLASDEKYWMHGGEGKLEGFPAVTCSTAYIAGEGHAGLKLREEAWRLERGGDADGHDVWVMDGMPSFQDADEFKALREATKKLGKPFPRLLVIDTMARAVAGMDENNASDMSILVKRCETLIEEFGCTVVLIHHVGHGDKTRARGSSAIGGAVHTILRVEAEKLLATLTIQKQKDALKIEPFALAARSVDLGKDKKGRERSSLVFDRAAMPMSKGHAERIADVAEKRLDAWVELFMDDRPDMNTAHVAAAIAAKTGEDPRDVAPWVRLRWKKRAAPG